MELIAIQWLVAIISATTGFIVMLKPVRAGLLWGWKKTLGRRGAQLDRIENELTHNGGTSLKDAIYRIEDRQYGMEAFFRAQLNLHNVAIVRTDKDGKLIAINRQYQRMTGYSLVEVRGDGWINAIHPDDRSKVKHQWDEAIAGGREYTEDIKFITASGDSFMAHASIFRELDSAGVIRGYLGTITPLLEPPRLIRPECAGLMEWVREQKEAADGKDIR